MSDKWKPGEWWTATKNKEHKMRWWREEGHYHTSPLASEDIGTPTNPGPAIKALWDLVEEEEGEVVELGTGARLYVPRDGSRPFLQYSYSRGNATWGKWGGNIPDDRASELVLAAYHAGQKVRDLGQKAGER